MFKPVDPKVDFPKLEHDLLEKWEEKGIVKKYLERNKDSSKTFSFLDGPITANNPMGVHHGWGRTYKDLWRRFFNMRGYRQQFRNGFDCQGLWVEVEVEKELGIKNKKEIENLVPGDKKASIAKFVELCKERVRRFSAIQTEQSKRLGYFMDWDNSYYTMSDENNYWIWRFLKTVYEKGWVYKGHDSVPWCPRCQTAISQHEMLTEDYKELTHETVFVKLPITTEGWENTYLLVWTTTPWTVPANVAVGVNTKYKYGVWEDAESKEKYIFIYTGEEGAIATRLDKEGELSLERYIMKDSGRTFDPPKKFYKGSELLGLKYEAPFDSLPIVSKASKENPAKFHTVVDGSEIVVDTEGTGLLHVAPGAGKEDFDLGKKESLPVISVIDDEAIYIEGMGEFSSKNAKKHPEIIIDYLKSHENGKYLLKTMRYTHRYPACWRCKTELVWKVTDEWYIAMDKEDKNGKTYRQQMIEVAKKIHWIPSWGLDRELDWLNNMHDWLISKKNRYWGLALPIYECTKCGNFEVLGGKDELQERAIEGWSAFGGNSPHKPFIDEVKIKCSKCGEITSRVDDVGNVWLDAGIVPFSTMPEEYFPADFITESFPGQFKNWFYSLIAMSTALKNTNPFKTVLGYASVRDEKGEEMHKSKGNSIEFNEAADKLGVDVMRWLYARTNPEHNVNFGYNVADEIRRLFHLRLWNVYAFFVTYASIDKWTPLKTEWTPKHVLDKWILSRMHGNIENMTGKEGDERGLVNYNAYDAAGNAEIFIIRDLSNWYVRRIRDRVGLSAQDEKDKSDAYQTLWLVLTTYSRALAPFMPFITEEIYTNLTKEESVHLADWPKFDESLRDRKLEEAMENAINLTSEILALRKLNNVKVRIPLRSLEYKGPTELTEKVMRIVLAETNVYELVHKGKKENYEVSGDTSEKNQDVEMGQARDIVRQIQEERKRLGTELDEKVDVTLPEWPKEQEEYIKKNALVANITQGEFHVKRAA